MVLNIMTQNVLKDFLEAQNLFEAELEIGLEEKARSKSAGEKKEKGNVFSITYAFEKRDKKAVWINLQKFLSEGIAAENLIGVLFWKVKTMLAENRPGKFTGQELKNISARLIAVYHDGHRGLVDMPIELEKIILETL